jgi:glycosyltransferase involved in cell wall biosynthesis
MRDNLKIIHLASTKRWTGVAEPMTNLAFHQKALGCDVFAGFECGRSFEKYVRALGISVLEGLHLDSRMNPVTIIKDVRILRRHILALKPDVIHAHLLHDHWIAILAVRGISPRPLIIRTMHRFGAPYADPVHRHLFTRLTDAIIVPSHAMRRLVLQRHPMLEKSIFVIYGGVNQARFHPGVDGKAMRRSLDIPEDAPVLGLVSRLRKDRGFDWLFAALPKVFSDIPEARLMIVGRGEMERDIRERIKHPPFAGRIIMGGYRTHDLPQAYRAMNASLFLAMGSEGSCRAVMEAMASGIPVIGVRQGVVPEIIKEGETGFIVAPNDIHDLAEKISSALSNLSRLEMMGKSARSQSAQMFRLLNRAEETIDIYETLRSRR